MSNTVGVYEAFKESIKKEVQNARISTIVRSGRFRADYLFGIENPEDQLYKTVISGMEDAAYRQVEILLYNLCREYGYRAELEAESNRGYDVVIDKNGEIFNVELKSAPSIHRPIMKKSGKPKNVYYVYLLKQSMDSYDLLGRSVLRAPETKAYLFADFIQLLFGEDEMQEFNKAMLHFSEEMRDAIGFQVTEICNEKNLDELRMQMQRDLLTFDYDSVRSSINAPVYINERNYGQIKNHFSATYKLLLGSKDFAISFLTSEWLYRHYTSIPGLDNTFIVEGYHKSIEQLLWNIIFIVGKGRVIGRSGHQVDGADLKPFDIMLGQLKDFLTSPSNADLYNTTFGNNVSYIMAYLETVLKDWTDANRNKYSHKETLTEEETVERIRKETYFLYLMILGSLHLSSDNIIDLM